MGVPVLGVFSGRKDVPVLFKVLGTRVSKCVNYLARAADTGHRWHTHDFSCSCLPIHLRHRCRYLAHDDLLAFRASGHFAHLASIRMLQVIFQ